MLQTMYKDDRTIAQLLVILNNYRGTDGQKPLKSWSESKAKLLDKISNYESIDDTRDEPPSTTDGGKCLETEAKAIDNAKAQPMPDQAVTYVSADRWLPAVYLTYDAAIKFIRKHRRRRHIFIRVATIVVAEGGSPYDQCAYVKCSAKQAREFVGLILGAHQRENGHVAKIAVDPELPVPSGSKNGVMYVG